MSQKINFRTSTEIIHYLKTALKKEQEKYEKCPIVPDMMPGHEAASAWGFVITGYFLVEQAIKALLQTRRTFVPGKHSLMMLFNLLNEADKDMLREFYSDFRGVNVRHDGVGFPFKELDEFLINLDGDPNKKGDDHIGSFEWRYFLIEEPLSQTMPFVGIEFLHEVAFACISIITQARHSNQDASKLTVSWRLGWDRQRKYDDWLLFRMNSGEWSGITDRLEILWGPDYRGWHDMLVIQKGSSRFLFGEIPSTISLPIIDSRREVEQFDFDSAWASLSMTNGAS